MTFVPLNFSVWMIILIQFSVLTWYTANLRVTSEANRTVADRFVVPDVALGVGSTVARVNAVTVVASLSLRAVIVCLTTNHNNS